MEETRLEFNYNVPEKANLMRGILDIFSNGFNSLLSQSSCEKEKSTLIEICPSMFRKWFISPIIADTPLTPANILSSLTGSDFFNMSVSVSENGGTPQYLYTIYENSYENDAFINDIINLCRSCSPVSDFDFFSPDIFYKLSGLMPQISVKEGYYITYIAQIALNIGLIKKMPSINAVKYQADEGLISDFLSKNKTEQYNIILKEAINIFTDKISSQTYTDIPAGSNKEILNLILSSNITDDIFAYIYSLMGLNFSDIIKTGEKKHLSEEDESLISSVFFISTLIDKYLLTPLGCYMGLISSNYSLQYIFSTDYDYIRPIITTGCDLSFELFDSPNYYALTKKGISIIGEPANASALGEMKNNITEEDINEITQAWYFVNTIQSSHMLKSLKGGQIYRLRLSFCNDESMWKIMEMPCESTLSQLKDEINLYFGFSASPNYSFKYNGVSYNGKHKNLNSAAKTTLKTLNLSEKSVIMYSDGNDRKLDLKIEASNLINGKNGVLYPRLLKQSRNITEKERGGEF